MTPNEARKKILGFAVRLGERSEELFNLAKDKLRSSVKLSVLAFTLSNEDALKMWGELDGVAVDDVSSPDDEDWSDCLPTDDEDPVLTCTGGDA